MVSVAARGHRRRAGVDRLHLLRGDDPDPPTPHRHCDGHPGIASRSHHTTAILLAIYARA
jgi:hypothetical protein